MKKLLKPITFKGVKPITFKGESLQGVHSNSTITGEPEISVTVLVEEAGEGSAVAAPIAKKILEEWFGR